MRHVVAILSVAAALIGGARTGQAAITFEYDAACTFQCSNIGLNIGDPVSGFISFNDAAVSPGATLGKADVLGFAFDFGTVDITLWTAQAFDFSGVLNGTATAFSLFEIKASEGLSPNGGETIDALEWGFSVGPGGNCGDATCSFMAISRPASGGAGTLALQEVPEPGTLALFGAALAGLALVRRRRA
jgi:hypothetical protein